MHRDVAAAAVELLDPPGGALLVDVCGGTGLVARAALPRLRAAVVVDASAGMLAEARACDPRLLLARGDAHRLPLPDAIADAVTIVTALHLLDPPTALREAVRVLRPGGRLVVTTWAADGWSVGRLLRDAARDAGLVVADPQAHGTPRAFAELAGSAGLHDVEVRRLAHRSPLPPEPGRLVRETGASMGVPEHLWPAAEAALVARGGVELVLLLLRGQTDSPSR